jgi:hypothetical protein
MSDRTGRASPDEWVAVEDDQPSAEEFGENLQAETELLRRTHRDRSA